MERPPPRRPQIKSGKVTLDAVREVAKELEAANWIGTLHVSAGDSEKYVYFSVGGVRLVSSGSRKYTSLGRLLVRRGVVSQHDLAKALASQGATKARLGDILQKWKLATKADLERMVQLQVENEIVDIVTWDDGEFRFHRGMPGDLFERSARATTVSLPLEPLVARMVSAAEKWDRIRNKIPHFAVVYRLTELGRQEAESPEAGPARQDFLQLVDGQRPLKAIAQAAEFGRFELAEIAFDALQGGLLQPVAGMSRATGTDASEIRQLEQALEQALNDVLIRRKLAEAYERAGDVPKAVEHYRHLADDAARSYREDDAIGALERVTRLQSTEFGAHEQLLDAYLRSGRKQRSIEQGSRLGDLYRKHRLFNRAKQVLMKVIGLAPRNLRIRTLLGDTYADLGDAPAAVQEWEQAIGVLREEKSEPGVVRQVAEKILSFDAGNRVARKVLAKMGEAAAPLAPVARATLLVATGAAVAVGVWWERSAAAQYNAIAAGSAATLARGEFDPVLAALTELRASRPFSLTVTPAVLRHDEELRARRDEAAQGQAVVALGDAEALEAAGEPEAALETLARAQQAAAGRRLPPDVESRLTRKVTELQGAVHERRRQAGRVLEELSQSGRDQALLQLAKDYAPALARDPRLSGQRPLQVPLRSTPAGAHVADAEGRTLGATDADVGRTVKVPVPLGGRLQARLLATGFEPAALDVAWTAVEWPHLVELQREAVWRQALGAPAGPPVLGEGDAVWLASVDRHLYRCDRRGGASRAIALGLDGEAVGAPLAHGGLAFVATAAGQLRGFTPDGTERVRVRLPGPPGAGPVLVGSWLVQLLADGACWTWPADAVAALAVPADGTGVPADAVPGALPPLALGQAPAGPPVGFRDDWLLLLSREGRFVSFELPSGRERFRRECRGRPTGAPAVAADGLCYIALTDGRLEARHVRSGDQAWKQPTAIPGGAASRPAVAERAVVVGSATDGAVAVDRQSGGVISLYPTLAPVHATPLVVGNVLYLADRAGWLSAWSLDPVGRQWRRRLEAPVSVGLRGVDGAILVVTDPGQLLAVRE